MKTSDFDYMLPPELIAQTPLEPRDHSRLMVLRRADGSLEHRRFFEIVDFLRSGDVLVFNDSRVLPARLRGYRSDTGGKVEVLLLRRLDEGVWETLVRPGRRVGVGARLEIEGGEQAHLWADVLEQAEAGIRVIRFSEEALLQRLGSVPLPPYIHTPLRQPERYQTVYAKTPGSVAAPTAGLHFTPELIEAIGARGVHLAFVTIHVGLDSFRPVRVEDPRQHAIHREYCQLGREVAEQLSRAKAEGRRIICVGTTTVRAVEEAARASRGPQLQPFAGWASLFILPGHRFRMVDGLVTNFHLPRSTLLMLVTAFAGKQFIDRAYEEAMALGYRFYSFGDCMLVL